MDLLFLNQENVQALLELDELMDGLVEGFIALSDSKVLTPNRSEITIPDAGFLLTMPAWHPGSPMSVKLVSVFHGNRQLGLPGHQALICLFDPVTGTPLAIMDGEYITAMRTAACAALSTRILAKPNAQILTIIGAGVQGQSHLKILPLVRDFSQIRIASFYYTDAQKLAASHPKARPVESYPDAVSGADVVCLCTNSGTPVISYEWLSPGAHVTSVGYFPPGSELPPEIIERGQIVVESRRAFEPAPIGCAELAGLDPSKGTELGEILAGKSIGRRSEDEITLYKSMGNAMEDMVAANLVYQRARQSGIGLSVKM